MASPGNDTIRLGPSPSRRIDTAQGRGGNDTIFGGWGRDDIQDGDGRDEVHGGRGADRFLLDSGVDNWDAGPGDDSFTVLSDGQPDQIACGPGRDTVAWEFRREALDQTTDCERDIVVS